MAQLPDLLTAVVNNTVFSFALVLNERQAAITIYT